MLDNPLVIFCINNALILVIILLVIPVVILCVYTLSYTDIKLLFMTNSISIINILGYQ